MAKKAIKKGATCDTGNGQCPCGSILAVLIIVLIWVSTATWSRVIITIAAALLLLSAGGCACKKVKKK